MTLSGEILIKNQNNTSRSKDACYGRRQPNTTILGGQGSWKDFRGTQIATTGQGTSTRNSLNGTNECMELITTMTER